MTNRRFPAPHDVETIPGTQGWQRMYPYNYPFSTDSAERTKYESEMFWFYDGLHYPEPICPFDLIWDEAWYLALSQFNARIFSVPPVLGVDHRIVNGYVYISPVPVKDPKEVEARIAHFIERAGYYYSNWDPLVAKWEEKIKATISALEGVKIEALPLLEDISVVTDAVGESKGYHLLRAYDEIIDLGIRCWQYHFEFLNLGYAAYVTFMDYCRKMFPDIPTQRVTQMIAGIDVIMYRPDAELKRLARLAIELDVDGILASSSGYRAVEAALKETQRGQEWLAAMERIRYPWFNVSTGTGWYHHDRSWNDDLSVPLNSIAIYAEKLRKGESIDRPLAKIQQERDRIVDGYRALLPNDEAREGFDQLLNTAKTVFPYVENHLFYVEHWFHSVFWNKVREVAAIMQSYGFINDVEDIWYFKRTEIKDALWDLVTAWATGVKPRGPDVWPAEVEFRKGVMEKFRAWAPPPALGVAPEVIQEPFTVVLWGVTNESLASWAKNNETERFGDIKKFSGFAASPGTVEGVARVCRTVDQIRLLQDGEILVAPTTSPSWAPAFVKIKACVTDVGGAMCHAAIVCREYGVPAVVGTGHATKIITDGELIRVNGTTGEIEVLEAATEGAAQRDAVAV
jgi:pyruvate,water dikinase